MVFLALVSDHGLALYVTGVAGALASTEAVEEVGVEEEQGEVEQEVAAVEEVEVEVEAVVEARQAGHQQQLVIPVDRPGWSVQEGTVAQDF